VLVLDPNLIPQFVDVVIGDHLYELQFHLEENMNEDNLEPMDMDDSSFGDDDENLMGGKELEHQDKNLSKWDNGVVEESSRAKQGNVGSHGKMVPLDQFEVVSVPESKEVDIWAIVPGSPSAKGSGVVLSLGEDGVTTPEVMKLATVPEADVRVSVPHRSKRRATNSVGDSIERASRLKAARNLDKPFAKGAVNLGFFVCFSYYDVLTKLQSLGFNFANNTSDVQKLVVIGSIGLF
jgi:hypothetical protein